MYESLDVMQVSLFEDNRVNKETRNFIKRVNLSCIHMSENNISEIRLLSSISGHGLAEHIAGKVTGTLWPNTKYRKVSNISRTKSQNLNASRLIL